MRRKSYGFFHASRFLAGGVWGSLRACRIQDPVDQPCTSSAARSLVASVGGLKTIVLEASMPNTTQGAPAALAISHIAIRQDADGRFSLNDLHKASGDQAKHKPSEWLRNQQAKDLIAELENEKAGIPALQTIKGTRSPGTYVVKELVYAYAMWISPSFHLKVIRAYDALQTQSPPPAQAKLPAYDNITAFHPDVIAAIEHKAQTLTFESYERTKQELLNTLKEHGPKTASTKLLVEWIAQIGWMNKDLVIIHRDLLFTLTSRLASFDTLFDYTLKAVHDLEKATGIKWYGRKSEEK
jgi:hypothetical protein